MKLNSLQNYKREYDGDYTANKIKEDKSYTNFNYSKNLNNSLSYLTEEKNSFFSNQHQQQDRNNIYFNKPTNISNKNSGLNFPDVNISTIDNLNSSIDNNCASSAKKTIDDVKSEINERKKANQKLLNEINLKTKRNFRYGNNFYEDEEDNFIKPMESDLYIKNKNYEKLVFEANALSQHLEEDDINVIDERRSKIAEVYRNKNMRNKGDTLFSNFDYLSGKKRNYQEEIKSFEYDHHEKSKNGKFLFY